MNSYKNKFGFTIYCIHIYVISLNTINRLRKGRIRNQNQNIILPLKQSKELCYSGYQVNSIKPNYHETQQNPQM